MKSLSKQDVGKSRTKSKVSNELCSIWERKLYVLSGNSTSEVTEKRSAHITAPRTVWLNRSSCVSIYSGAIHIPTYLPRGREGGRGNTSFRQNIHYYLYSNRLKFANFREFHVIQSNKEKGEEGRAQALRDLMATKYQPGDSSTHSVRFSELCSIKHSFHSH